MQLLDGLSYLAAMAADLPFENLVVLELASVLAGPSVGMFFAELGATVIKVENPVTAGDITRSWKIEGENPILDISAYFSAVNWGKRSIALNLDTVEDKKTVFQLIKRAGIVLVSFKPGDAEKFGMDYDSIERLNPGIIYGEITGYGQNDTRTAFDAVLQAETGFMFMNGTVESGPVKMPVALIDILAGHQLKEGLLLALLKKEKTGKGSRVSVSLFDSAIASLANQAANWLVAGAVPKRMGSSHPNIAPYGDYFTTNDGKFLLLAVGNDRQFLDLCIVLSIPELSVSKDFLTNSLRVHNREKLKNILADAIQKIDIDNLLEKLHSKKVPSAEILNLEQVFSMPMAADLIMDKGIKGVRTAVFHFPNPDLLPPPKFNEHSLWLRKEFLGE